MKYNSLKVKKFLLKLIQFIILLALKDQSFIYELRERTKKTKVKRNKRRK